MCSMSGVSCHRLMALTISLVLVLLTQGLSVSAQNKDYLVAEARLYEHLMLNYSRDIRPALFPNNTIHVQHGMGLVGFDGLDEKREVLSLHIWERMAWKDPRLAWDPAQFGDISTLRLPPKELWKPDIIPYNLHLNDYARDAESNAVVNSNGDVLWIPMVFLTTSCAVDMTYFPYDEQKCTITLGSWTYDGLMMNVTMWRGTEPLTIETKFQHASWEIVSTSSERFEVIYACCPEPYITLSHTLSLRRRSTYINHVFVAPACLLALLLPLMFLLPPGGTHKIQLGSGLLVSMILLLMMLERFIPSSHPTVPHIGRYYLACLILNCISLLASILSANIWTNSMRNIAVPEIARMVCLGVFGRILFVRRDTFLPPESELMESVQSENQSQLTTDSTDDQRQILSATQQVVSTAEWQQLAVVVDRLCLATFTIVVVVVSAVMIK